MVDGKKKEVINGRPEKHSETVRRQLKNALQTGATSICILFASLRLNVAIEESAWRAGELSERNCVKIGLAVGLSEVSAETLKLVPITSFRLLRFQVRVFFMAHCQPELRVLENLQCKLDHQPCLLSVPSSSLG